MTHVSLAELITMCSLASSPSPDHVHDTLYRVVIAHSAGAPHMVLDATTSQTYTPHDPARAAAIVARLEASSHKVHVGLAGLSSHMRARYSVTPAEALDPCTNIGFASLELELVLTRKTRKDPDALHRALAAYFSPEGSDHLQAIDWGSRVLTVPPVSVAEQVDAVGSRRHPTVTFTLQGPSIFGQGGQAREPVPPPPTSAPLGSNDERAKQEDEANESDEPGSTTPTPKRRQP